MAAARVEAYSCLMRGFICLALAGGLVFFAKYLAHKVMNEDWDEITWMPISFIGVAALILFIIGAWSFLDPWTWTAINQPELWIAKKAFKL